MEQQESASTTFVESLEKIPGLVKISPKETIETETDFPLTPCGLNLSELEQQASDEALEAWDEY